MLDSLESIYDAVSIPAPLARSNHDLQSMLAGVAEVSIPAPLARSNVKRRTKRKPRRKFQYLLLLRGATTGKGARYAVTEFQYLLLLRGAT